MDSPTLPTNPLYRLAVAAALILPAASLRAAPLAVVDLKSTSAWSYKGETDAGWSTMAIPGHRGAGSQKWIEYRRTLSIPNVVAGQATVVRFLSVNDGGIVFIDDVPVDTIAHALFPAEVDITRFTRPGGTHTLRVRCYNRAGFHGGTGYIPSGMNYGRQVGIPRGAALEVHPGVRIADAVTRTSVATESFHRDLWISNASDSPKSITVKGSLAPWNAGDSWAYPTLPDQAVTIPARSTLKVSQGPIRWGLGPRSYWWPNIPFEEGYTAKLHFLQVSLYEGERRLDSTSHRFGFVEHSEGPYYYKVNGVKVFQMGDGVQETHFGGGFQRGWVVTEGWGAGPLGAKETWKRYMRMGMNSFRFHTSAATEIMNNAADEVGFLTIPESALRGYADPLEAWHDFYKPEAIKGMVRYYRKHPSVARYSLDNEYAAVTENEGYARKLIDAAMSEDNQRPLSFSQNHGPWEKKFTGTAGLGSAWAMSHYREPPNDTVNLKGIEEMFWGQNGSYKYELVECARAGILYRLRNYAVFHPWTWQNYWMNFVQGSSKAAGTHPTGYGNKDRRDNIDGWGSNIIRFVQNCYHVFASADVDIIQNRLTMNEDAFFPVANAITFENAQSATRKMVMFNNSLAPHVMRIRWEARLDSAKGMPTASGATDPVTLQPGCFAQPTIVLPLPGTNNALRTLHFVVKTEVDGAIRFTEDRFIFRVRNAGAPISVPISISPPAAILNPGSKAGSAARYGVDGRRIDGSSAAPSADRGGNPADRQIRRGVVAVP